MNGKYGGLYKRHRGHGSIFSRRLDERNRKREEENQTVLF